jgi:acyl-coenzyme A synthetase/AMP-(fatty) acid ligase
MRPNGFLLEGRRDQIVKVSDKRVNLGDLERRLNVRADVKEARIVPLESGVLAAVVVPTEGGWLEIRRLGKRPIQQRAS